jgi:sterol desaturase/sphingolipid hydroxylase (fatty acid hydroxylase superfamily)
VTGVLAAWWSIVADLRYLVGLVALLGVERFVPATTRGPRVGLAQDAVWFVMSSLLLVTVVAAYLAGLSRVLDALTGSWHLDLVPVLGSGVVAVLAFVVGDFIEWCSHRLHHRFRVLWAFHAVHHSQTSLNILSDNRQHVVETMATATCVFVPARLLGLGADEAGALALLTLVLSAFIHANIRTDLGPLRFVLVSPQAHRIHHSTNPDHYDTNYGNVLSCWDYLFRTRHPDRDLYPATGIEDTAFPLERSVRPGALMRTWIAQTLYPFRALRVRAPRVRVPAR